MYASIDLVCDKLRVKLRKMKEKVTDRRHERSRVHVRTYRLDAVMAHAAQGPWLWEGICVWGEPHLHKLGLIYLMPKSQTSVLAGEQVECVWPIYTTFAV